MKIAIKNIINILSFVICLPLILVAQLEKIITKNNGEEIFRIIGQILSLVPGKIGSYIRVAYYNGILEEANVGFYIAFGSYFLHRKVVVERNVYIGAYSIIGYAHIEKDVMIASRVSIISGQNMKRNCSGRVVYEKNNSNVIRIGTRSWIGEGAIVMDNVGPDCIVGAGAVVTKNIPGHITAVGNPVRFMQK